MQSSKRTAGWLTLLALVILLAACGPSAAPVTSTDTPAPEPSSTTAASPTLAPTSTPLPTATPVPPTQTPEPSATTPPTATPQPPLAVTGLGGWCLPPDTAVSYASDPLNPPPGAKIGTNPEAGGLEIRNLPASSCVILYTFNQPAPEGLTLEIHEPNQDFSWLTAKPAPLENGANAASVLLRHTYIVAPPLWEVHYEFVLRDGANNVLRRDPVDLYRWTPELCWNGRLPDPITLRCPLQQDLHPWDAGYGTPMPTPKREE